MLTMGIFVGLLLGTCLGLLAEQHTASSTSGTPALVYSTYAGAGPYETAVGVAVDQDGSAYVLSSSAGSMLGPRPIVKKLSPDGSRLIFSTTLPAFLRDDGPKSINPDQLGNAAIAVDPAGDIYVAGTLRSGSASLFRPTPGAAQEQAGDENDSFVLKLSADGLRVIYATFLGGSDFDLANGIAVDSEGNAYVTGFTQSRDFPVTSGSFQTSFAGGRDAFVVKLNPGGTAFTYATYLGGGSIDAGTAIAVDGGGNAYVTGSTESADFPSTHTIQGGSTLQGDRDAFIAKLDASGTTLLHSGYLGGTGSDVGLAIAVDLAGGIYATGGTSSQDFPLQSPLQAEPAAAFVTKVRPEDGGELVYSTYLGSIAWGTGIAVDAEGGAFITGVTFSNFPTTEGAFQRVLLGSKDAFLARLSPAGSELVYSTFLGGTGDEDGVALALDSSASAYLAGTCWGACGFPTTKGAYKETSTPLTVPATMVPVVARIETSGIAGAPELVSLVNAASRLSTISAGTIVDVVGRGFGPPTQTGFRLTDEGKVDTILGGTRLLFDGVAAPLISAGPGQLRAVLPYAVDGKSSTEVSVEWEGVRSSPVNRGMTNNNPAFFTVDSYGTGQAVAFNQDGSVNSPANPAPIGSQVKLLATGEGQTMPPGVDGQLAGSPGPVPALPVSLNIGQRTAEVLSAGGAPGEVAGYFQVVGKVPEGVSPGPAVPVTVYVGTSWSMRPVTIAVGKQ